jgi:hypothetical protein
MTSSNISVTISLIQTIVLDMRNAGTNGGDND